MPVYNLPLPVAHDDQADDDQADDVVVPILSKVRGVKLSMRHLIPQSLQLSQVLD